MSIDTDTNLSDLATRIKARTKGLPVSVEQYVVPVVDISRYLGLEGIPSGVFSSDPGGIRTRVFRPQPMVRGGVHELWLNRTGDFSTVPGAIVRTVPTGAWGIGRMDLYITCTSQPTTPGLVSARIRLPAMGQILTLLNLLENTIRISNAGDSRVVQYVDSNWMYNPSAGQDFTLSVVTSGGSGGTIDVNGYIHLIPL